MPAHCWERIHSSQFIICFSPKALFFQHVYKHVEESSTQSVFHLILEFCSLRNLLGDLKQVQISWLKLRGKIQTCVQTLSPVLLFSKWKETLFRSFDSETICLDIGNTWFSVWPNQYFGLKWTTVNHIPHMGNSCSGANPCREGFIQKCQHYSSRECNIDANIDANINTIYQQYKCQ